MNHCIMRQCKPALSYDFRPCVKCFPANRLTKRKSYRRSHVTMAEGASSPWDPSEEDLERDPSFTGSAAWRSRPPSVALPKFLQQAPGHWFMLAGFLKIMFMCQMYPFGSTSLVVFGTLHIPPFATMLTAGLGLAGAASLIVESGWLDRRGVPFLITFCCLLVLGLSTFFNLPKVRARVPEAHRRKVQAVKQMLAEEAGRRRLRTPSPGDSDALFAEMEKNKALGRLGKR
eukprot:jgi/Botrbrau1/1003/Bobra.114_1s0041.1